MRRLITGEAQGADLLDPAVLRPTLLTARKIMAPQGPAEAMVITLGRILFLGTVEEARSYAAGRCLPGTAPEEVDLGDSVVSPGFVDPHAHPLMYGQMMTWVDCGPEAAGSIPELIAALRRTAESLPAGAPVRGYGYEQKNLAEGRHPHREELDQVATDRPVYLMNASGHGGVVNSYTLQSCGVDENTPNPPGGEYFRDAQGRLTGEVSDAACNALTGQHGVKIGNHGPNFHLGDSPEQHVEQLLSAQQMFLSRGVTAVGDAQVSRREFDTYLRAAEQGALRMRVGMYLLSHLLDSALEIGLHGAFGSPLLSYAGIKLYADGTLGGSTAYFPEGYADDPCRHGQLYHSPEEYSQLLLKAHRAGIQTATHAQSPAALEMVLEAVDAAQRQSPRPDARHRIEHCGLPEPEQVARMAQLGIIPVTQTQHYFNWGDGLLETIGALGERFNPLGEFAAHGIPYALSSDAPVAAPDPLQAIGTAVTRITRSGAVHGPEHLKVTAEDALAAHTLRGARALGREDDIGSLTPGKRADLTVLEADPTEVAPEDITTVGIRQTWIGGRLEWEAGS